jgi:hypothetical protein
VGGVRGHEEDGEGLTELFERDIYHDGFGEGGDVHYLI